MNKQNFDEMREALIAISSNEHLDLGDLIYDVRKSEGEGWDGQWVKHWSDAVMKVNNVVKKIQEHG